MRMDAGSLTRLGSRIYIGRVPAPDLCNELVAWSTLYPVPSAPAERNDAARMNEDRFLARFAGLAALDRDQAAALIGWKFQGMAHRKTLALRGISPERWEDHDGLPGAAAVIRSALASSDDYQALAAMAGGVGGIYRFGPAMSSVILAACQPRRFTVADSRALKTVRRLGLMPPGPAGFRLEDWLPYLTACRTLARTCGLSLRQLDRALWVGTSDPLPPSS
jgi:hypothetical protein